MKNKIKRLFSALFKEKVIKGFSLKEKQLSPIRFIMLHKLGVRKGFSLIELLVVIGIIGVLAAIAIPAYQTYRDNAAKGALKVSLQNVGKAQQVCRVKPENNSLSACTTLSDINVTCEKCSAPQAMDPRWCVQAEDGGLKSCLMILDATSPPTLMNSWEKINCKNTYTKFTCTYQATPRKGTWAATGTNCSGITSCTNATVADTTNIDSCPSDKYVACTGTPAGNQSGECQPSGFCK